MKRGFSPTRHVSSGTTTPLHIYITTLIAFLTVLGFNDRPTLRTFTWVCVGIYSVATLMSGDSALVGPGEVHWFENDTDGNFSFVEFWAPPPADTVWTVTGDRCTWAPSRGAPS